MKRRQAGVGALGVSGAGSVRVALGMFGLLAVVAGGEIASAGQALAADVKCDSSNTTSGTGSETACGSSAVTAATGATAIGAGAYASGAYATTLGLQAKATNSAAISVGYRSNASGLGAVAIGMDSAATGDVAFAAGLQSLAAGDYAFALGTKATAQGERSAAMGYYSIATGRDAFALGTMANAQAERSIATGYYSVATASDAFALGTMANAQGERSGAMGYASIAKGPDAFALGTMANAQGERSAAMGYASSAAGIDSLAFGTAAAATALDAIAVGRGSSATVAGGIALGSGSVANTAAGVAGFDPATGAATTQTSPAWQSTGGAVSVGDPAGTTPLTRQITGVAAGTVDTDAVNVAQLKAVNTIANAGWTLATDNGGSTHVAPGGTLTVTNTDGNVKVGPASGGAITVNLSRDLSVDSVTAGKAKIDTNGLTITGGPSVTASGIDAGGTKLTGLAAGAVAANSTDAVTGGQLYSVSQQVAGTGQQVAALNQTAVKYVTDGSGNPTDTVRLTGSGSGNAVTIKNLAAGQDATDAVNVGQLRQAIDGIAQDSPLNVKYTPGINGKPSNTLALTGDGSGAPVKVTNVAAGKADSDAVNYGQVKNQVGYDTDSTGARTGTVTLSGKGTAPVRIANLADGVQDSDAASFGQVRQAKAAANAYTDAQVGALRDYTNTAINNLTGQIRSTRQEARGGIAATAAQSQLRFVDKAGVVSLGAGFGGYKSATAFAAGIGWTSQDMRWRANASVGIPLNGGGNSPTWSVGAAYAFD